MSTPSFVSRLQILGAAILFSTGGAAIKSCALSAWQVASFRSGVAALALLAILPSSRRFWRPGNLLVGVAYAGTMAFYVGGNKLTTAANTIFLQSTAPLYLLLLGPLVLRERLRRGDALLASTIGAGMLLLFVGVEPPRDTAPQPGLGNLLGAFAGLSWAFTILGLRWLGRRPEPDRGTAEGAVVAGNLMACLACLPLALAMPLTEAGPSDAVLVLFLGVFQIGLAYVWMTRGVRDVRAFEVSLLLLLEPVLNPVWTWLVHGERPSGWSFAGCAVILVATLSYSLSRRREASSPAGPADGERASLH